MGMVGEACLPNNAYYPRTPDYTLYSGVHVCWSEHSDSSFVYGFTIRLWLVYNDHKYLCFPQRLTDVTKLHKSRRTLPTRSQSDQSSQCTLGELRIESVVRRIAKTDQSAHPRRLSRVFAGRKCNIVGNAVTRFISFFITKTRLYNFDPLKPHFYIVKLGFSGVYIIFLIFLFLLENIDCGYSLEPPRLGYQHSMF